MSEDFLELKCRSCGLEGQEIIDASQNICNKCLKDGELTEPEFDAIVYAVAFGYFIGKNNVENSRIAVSNAYDYVINLPYWRDNPSKCTNLEFILEFLPVYEQFRLLSLKMLQSESCDFYVSFAPNDDIPEFTSQLVSEMAKIGYTVTTSDMNMKDNARAIRNSKFSVLILSTNYFDPDVCKHGASDLKEMFDTKDSNHIFPIWWKGVEKSFLSSQLHGSQILSLAGYAWGEHQGSVNSVINKLSMLKSSVEGMRKYQGATLYESEVLAMEDLQDSIGEPIPNIHDSVKETEFGFDFDGNSVVTLILRKTAKGRKFVPISLPESIINLKFLKELNANLREIPRWLNQLPNLKILNLRSNDSLKKAESLEVICSLPSLEELHMGWCTLRTLPESLGNIKTLKKLELGYNWISDLPESIGELFDLKHLNLNSCRLKYLPNSIGNLKSLQELQLYSNQLKELPETITNLKTLQILNLGKNQLETLPQDIGNLTLLQSLKLGENTLSSLPESIGNLKSLKVLSVYDNQVTFLPESIGNLSSLVDFNARKNPLTSLPDSISQLTSLKTLSFSSEKLKNNKDDIRLLLKPLIDNGCKIYALPLLKIQ